MFVRKNTDDSVIVDNPHDYGYVQGISSHIADWSNISDSIAIHTELRDTPSDFEHWNRMIKEFMFSIDNFMQNSTNILLPFVPDKNYDLIFLDNKGYAPIKDIYRIAYAIIVLVNYNNENVHHSYDMEKVNKILKDTGYLDLANLMKDSRAIDILKKIRDIYNE